MSLYLEIYQFDVTVDRILSRSSWILEGETAARTWGNDTRHVARDTCNNSRVKKHIYCMTTLSVYVSSSLCAWCASLSLPSCPSCSSPLLSPSTPSLPPLSCGSHPVYTLDWLGCLVCLFRHVVCTPHPRSLAPNMRSWLSVFVCLYLCLRQHENRKMQLGRKGGKSLEKPRK